MLITWGKTRIGTAMGWLGWAPKSPLKTTRDAEAEGYACDHGSNKAARKTAQSLRENFKMFELFVNPTCSLGLDNLS